MAEAIIYLADRRGCTQSSVFRSFHTFNFGSYIDEHRKSFGDLYVFNDDTLKGGSARSFDVKEFSEVSIIPLVGAVEYKTSDGLSGNVEAGACHTFLCDVDSSFDVLNPFQNDLVNFLLIWRKTTYHTGRQVVSSEFDLVDFQNQLIPIEIGSTKGYIGKFAGRHDGLLRLTGSSAFIFVVEGAFEVQNRLLHARDGLSLTETHEIEFEALSNDAILLVIS